jgi:23S rRNA pseudouridine1911/1915/1917 synthase
MQNTDESSGDADYEFEVLPEDAELRLDNVLSRYLKEEAEAAGGAMPGSLLVPSRSKAAEWISRGFVKVNCRVATKPAMRLEPGALLSVTTPPPRLLTLQPDPNVLFSVIYEDEHVLVVNKPAGLVVHPGAGQEGGTLVNGLLHYLGDRLRQVGDSIRPGIVHRLDKDTSGLMVVAKNEPAFAGLVQQFAPPRTITRRYLALTVGLPGAKAQGGQTAALSGKIEGPIGRHPVHRKKMAVVASGGKEAATAWQMIEELKFGYLLELTLTTGRTHQIRVHLQQMGSPIVGDPIYGRPVTDLPDVVRQCVKSFGRQALHARTLEFIHPISKEVVRFEVAPPEDMGKLIEAFRACSRRIMNKPG